MNERQTYTQCDAEKLNELLLGGLSREETAAVESHLSQCASCAEQIQLAAATGTSWNEAQSMLALDEFDGLPSLSSAKSLFPAEVGDREYTPTADLLAREIRGWLDPTDDPQMLGRFAGYEIVGIIGHGGMGIVLKGFEASLNRYVAIKILAPRLAANGAARQRFAREAQAAAAVLHDNVVAIHRVDEFHGLPFLVMPYIADVSLQKRVNDEGPLPITAVLRIGSQIAAGLAAAHHQGLVHRDIKPANIMLEKGVERVTITDFGLARTVDDASLTKTGIIAGTPQYMSPEQARGESVDQRSDLFSLGSVLYTMCTGRAPFRAETSYGVLRHITDEGPEPIQEINPDIPEWLCQIVAKLMSKRPDDRFESAREVAELLEECLAHVQQPTAVPLPHSRPSPSERGERDEPLGSSPRLLKKPTASTVRLIAAAAVAFALVFAGILIVLELNKGTLAIECDADNVSVRITQGDKVVQELTVSKTGASVRVAAGRYVVDIDGAADGIRVENGTVKLLRGGREVVRIVKGASRPEVADRDLATIGPAKQFNLPIGLRQSIQRWYDAKERLEKTLELFRRGYVSEDQVEEAKLQFLEAKAAAQPVIDMMRLYEWRGKKNIGESSDSSAEEARGPGDAENVSEIADPLLSDDELSGYRDFLWSSLRSLQHRRNDLLSGITDCEQRLVEIEQPVEIPEGAAPDVKEQLEHEEKARAAKTAGLSERIESLRAELDPIEKQLDLVKKQMDELPAGRTADEIAFDAEILAVSDGHVEISVGSDDGVQTGMTFPVFRDEEYLGSIETVKVEADKSSARILSEDVQTPIRRGDRATMLMDSRASRIIGQDPGEPIYNDRLKRFKFRLEKIPVTDAVQFAADFWLRYRARGNPQLTSVLGDPRTNSLVVVGPPEADQAIRDVIAEWEGFHSTGIDMRREDASLEVQHRELQNKRRNALELVVRRELEIIEAQARKEPDGDELEELHRKLETEKAELEIIERKLEIISASIKRLQGDAAKEVPRTVDPSADGLHGGSSPDGHAVDNESSDRQSLAYAVKRFNASTAEVRSELFDPPIGDLTVERLREGFRQSAKLYRDRGKRQIADALLEIAESGRLPDEAVGGLIGSGTHAQDEDGKTISRQVVPALVLPDDSTPSGRLLVALRPLELFYRKDGPVSKDYGDLFDLETGRLIEGSELAADYQDILGHWEVVSVEGSGGRFMGLSDQSKPGDRLVIAHVETPNGRLWLSEAFRDAWSRDDSLHLHPKADPSRLTYKPRDGKRNHFTDTNNPPDYGIYRIQGNELTILAGDPRDFSVNQGTESVPMEYRTDNGATSPGRSAEWSWNFTIPNYARGFELEEGRRQIFAKLHRVGSGAEAMSDPATVDPTPADRGKKTLELSTRPVVAKPEVSDVERLQGVWLLESEEQFGEMQAAADPGQELLRVVIEGQTLLGCFDAPWKPITWSLEFDNETRPQAMYLTASVNGKEKTRSVRFRLCDDKLELCFNRRNPERLPVQLGTAQGSNAIIWHMRRADAAKASNSDAEPPP